MRIFGSCIVLVALIAAAGFCQGAGAASLNPAGVNTQEESIEYKLASIHNGGRVTKSDPLVAQFRRVLDQLEAKCPESRQQLADMGVKGQELLRDENIKESLLGIFRNWRASIPDEAKKGELGECSGILAAYIALRVGG
jgi:hypothetical protein